MKWWDTFRSSIYISPNRQRPTGVCKLRKGWIGGGAYCVVCGQTPLGLLLWVKIVLCKRLWWWMVYRQETTPIIEITSCYNCYYIQSWLCKAIGCIQCMAVFLSSASITLIAVDRYRYIIHPHSKQMSTLLVSRLMCPVLPSFFHPPTPATGKKLQSFV